MTTIYQDQLHPGRKEVRLLHLQPGDFEDPLRGNLQVCSILTSQPYAALSYVWGSKDDAGEICLDGELLPITHNLKTALQHIRCTTERLTIWIDAICINQIDVTERNNQVAIMGEIYASATDVFIWLGPADEYSDDAFATISAGHTENGDIRQTLCSFYLQITDRPWFSRVWIMQELALATVDPWVICGTKRQPWSVFTQAWDSLAPSLFAEMGLDRTTGGANEEDDVMTKTKLDTLNDMRRKLIQERSMNLRQLLIISRTSLASEPRDRIYGLRSMLSAEERSKIAVNYSRPIAEVYAEALRLIFANGEGPFYLSGVWLHGGKSSIPYMPSWVPDFTSQTAELAPRPPGFMFHPTYPLSASGAGHNAKNGKVLDDLKTLQVEGVLVDVVEETISIPSAVNDFAHLLGSITKLALSASERRCTQFSLAPYYERYKAHEPLWKTLVSNKRSGSGYDPAPALYERAFHNLLGTGGEAEPSLVQEYLGCLRHHLVARTFVTTRAGLVGVGMPDARVGDLITIWFGSPAPFIVRTLPTAEAYCTLVGPAYISGIMSGEIVDDLYCEDLMDSQTFRVT
jgi:hypothetical protein